MEKEKMKRCIFIVLLILPTNIHGQMFSVESIVTPNYINQGLTSQYYFSREFSDDYYKDWKGSELKYVSIPDSIAGKIFKIKKGDYVTQIYDGKLTGTDTISAFEIAIIEGAGRIFYFNLKNLQSRHEGWYDNSLKYFFYVIGPKDVTLPSVSEINDNSLMDSLASQTLEYLLVEKDSESVQRVLRPDWKTSLDALEVDSLETLLNKCCQQTISKIYFDGDSRADYIVEFHPVNRRKEGCFRDFSFIFTSLLDSPFIIPYSHFELAVEVNEKQYLMFRKYKPDTGIRGRTLYTFNTDDKKIEGVFGEYGMSD
jgi:hypothetical protein